MSLRQGNGPPSDPSCSFFPSLRFEKSLKVNFEKNKSYLTLTLTGSLCEDHRP